MIDHSNTIVVLTGRMASRGLPGKPLADLQGLPVIVHSWRSAVAAKLGPVLVAARENEIAEVIRREGGDAFVTSSAGHPLTGPASEALGLRDPAQRFEHVLVLPGDMPFLEPLYLQRCLAGLTNPPVDLATLAAPLDEAAARAEDEKVKIIAPLGDAREVAYARDFVRKLGPEHDPPFFAHLRIFAFRRQILERLNGLAPSTREVARSLPLLRALDHDLRIAAVRVDAVPLAVNTPAALERARQLLRMRQ